MAACPQLRPAGGPRSPNWCEGPAIQASS
jgi:hypothetical protein